MQHRPIRPVLALTFALTLSVVLTAYLALPAALAAAEKSLPPITPVQTSPDLEIRSATVDYLKNLDLLVFEQEVRGRAGGTTPRAKGQMDGAPVLGYVFPTNLESQDVGFAPVEGVVALAATSHPDFDDTPLWDENNDRDYANDGVIFHTHWVVLVPDERVPGGLAVRQIADADPKTLLPPTAPGMPMYMDSPGFSVVLSGNNLKILVPAARVSGKTDFRFDAVAAYMQVAQSGDRPLLGVYEVYSVLSGDLSLPYSVSRK
ncbi:MAG: hypothetical protein AAF657_15230 [Acidobacteriota bacterium]